MEGKRSERRTTDLPGPTPKEVPLAGTQSPWEPVPIVGLDVPDRHESTTEAEGEE